MTNKFIASVAAGALLAGVTTLSPLAFAQDTATPPTMETQPMQGTDGTSGTMTTPSTEMPAAGTTAAAPAGYLTEQSMDQIASSTYIGQSVYNAADESIGEINDLIFKKDGAVEAAVIGVGGFLGIGEKNVAVPFEAVTVSENPQDGTIKLTTQETADSLKAAPEFKTKAQVLAERNNGAAVDGSTTSSTGTGMTTAPATGTAPAQEPATAQ
ncbi:Sporulation protein YlmC, PRC-barrel domain family [Rhizobium sp. RU20A]|uniref:PRC-barrel domain-containing protein n=1 Tax=Rhizobium sp. RU20A TaxID=1907412 RepID=UPI0009541BC2|nr:PRC-barrel domain-containing protein [Rhizobium sp. RU20A]SIR07611.1 Sporulation protein YlmC, PRC-barrel domain family [Rhizobium sp. RU20A]